MLKFAMKDTSLYLKLSRHSWLEKFITFRMDALVETQDAKLASELYKRHRVSGGTTKETAPGRFQYRDEATLKILGAGPHAVHDVAVSSGITSMELYELLTAHGISFKLWVSDKFSKYFQKGTWIRRIYDADKKLLHAYCLGILADWKVSWKYPFTKFLFLLLSKTDSPGGRVSEIPLYDPSLLKMLRSGAIAEMQFDLFATELPPQFTFVRCMNVLNLNYFPEDRILAALRLLNLSMREGGVLLVGRTGDGGFNTATFFLKTGDGNLESILDLRGGSEIKSLVRKLSRD